MPPDEHRSEGTLSLSEVPYAGGQAFWFLFAGPALRRLKKGLAVRAKPPEAPAAATDMPPKPTFQTKDQKIAAFGSSYKSGSKARRPRKKNAPNQSGRFHEDAASVLQRVSERHPDAMRPG
jgi:hypothetical protein